MKALIERRGVHVVFGPAGEGWGIEQNPDELTAFIAEMERLGVQAVLEIGTGYKGGLSRFMAHDLGWQVTSVDINAYHHAYAGVQYILLPNASAVYENGTYDLVIIDGDHAYEAVRRDYFNYAGRAARAVMLHDIAGLRNCEGVRQFWREIAYTKTGKLRKGYHEIIAGENAGGIGWHEAAR